MKKLFLLFLLSNMMLNNQLQIVKQDNYNAGKVFELNQKYKLQDVNLEKN